MGFRSLQHLQDPKVHLPRAFRAHFVPPSGFEYPLGGFLPSNPSRPCFMPTALMGFTLRSVPPLEGTRVFPPARTHLPFRLAVNPLPEQQAGPPSPGSWASALPGIPCARRVFSTPNAGCSLGFRPPEVSRRRPGSKLPPNSSLVLGKAFRPEGSQPRAPQSLDQPSPDSVRDRRIAATAGQSNPFRVFVPVRSETFGRVDFRAMSSPLAASCIAADRPTILGNRSQPTGVAPDRLGH
jgi:hypothetical protein